MKAVYETTLDVQKSGYQTVIDGIRKNDAGVRELCIRLSDGVRAFALDERCTAVTVSRPPDGGDLIYGACTVDAESGTVRHMISAAETAAVGTVICEVRLMRTEDDGQAQIISTPQFKMIVRDSMYNGGEVENDERFDALAAALDRVIDAEEGANAAAENADGAAGKALEAADTATSAATSAAEAAGRAESAAYSANNEAASARQAAAAANTAAEGLEDIKAEVHSAAAKANAAADGANSAAGSAEAAAYSASNEALGARQAAAAANAASAGAETAAAEAYAAAERAESAGKAWYVSFTERGSGSHQKDKTWSEIVGAYKAGYAVYAIAKFLDTPIPYIIPLKTVTEGGDSILLFSGAVNIGISGDIGGDTYNAGTEIVTVYGYNNMFWSMYRKKIIGESDVPTADIEANTAARHTHENKEILDSITAMPTALKNPNALTIKVGSTTVTYDGSSAKTVEIAEGSGGGASAAGGSQLLYGVCSSVTASGDTNIYTVSGITADINEGDMLNVFFIGLSENTKSSVRLSINGKKYYISRSYVNMSLSRNPKFFEAGSFVSFCFDNTDHAIITNGPAWDSPYYEVKKAGYTGTISKFYTDLAGLLNGIQGS